MNELIRVNYDNNDTPTVSGRELHTLLGVKTAYKDWFPRMCEYGFTEAIDYCSFLSDRSDGKAGKPKTDHALTIEMAKELCMLQRNEKGKQARAYFIELEKQWNSPEAVLARALKLANAKIDSLGTTISIQEQQIAELKPKASYYDLVLNCPDLLSVSEIAKDYGKTANWLNKHLQEKGVQFKQGGIWLLYQKYAEQGYTSTKTHPYNGKDGKTHTRPHTYWNQKGRLFIYDLLKQDGILPIMERNEMA